MAAASSAMAAASSAAASAPAEVPAARPGLKARLAGVWPVGELTGWLGASGFGSHSTASEVLRDVPLQARVFIVTGGNAGLGYAAAKALACAGATVIIACRSAERGAAAAAELSITAAEKKGGSVAAMQCDLSSAASVRAFAAAFLATGQPLHGLICNGAPPAAGWLALVVLTRVQAQRACCQRPSAAPRTGTSSCGR